MPKLIIDSREIEVPAGTKVIEAAEQLGIVIPRFCYHPALGSVGACRVCAVAFKDGPVKGIQMSCMVDAQNGMVVSTTDPDAADFRKSVIEWLMLNHPHDCPVCDVGGNCLLQDMTVAGGHGLRRFPGLKRTHNDQYLGPLIQHEMNRCIQCYRCSRYYQEFAGYRDLGVMGSAARVYFGRNESGRLESPFSGNLLEVCPTGVYTDKPSRYFGRRWEFERAPSICLHCSLGCNLVASARYRKVVRHEARPNKSVNGYFICDRGRYGYPYASHEDRPRQVLFNGQAIQAAVALRQAREKLDQVADRFGADSIATIGSARCSLEALAVLAHGTRENKWQGPSAAMTDRNAENIATAVNRLKTGNPISLQDVAAADTVLVIGADPLNEAPMLALSLRQVARKNGRVTTIDPRGIELPLTHEHWTLDLPQLQNALERLIRSLNEAGAAPSAGDYPSGLETDRVAELARQLKSAKTVAVVCGLDIVSCEIVHLAADLAEAIAGSDTDAGLFYVMGGANDFATGMMDAKRMDAASINQILDRIEDGKIRALIVVESDLWHRFPDQERLGGALHHLDLLIVMDHVSSPLGDRAQLFIPTQTVHESGGHWINNEGRLQTARAVFGGGAPIEETGNRDHPPREFAPGIPGSTPTPAWRALAELMMPTDRVKASTAESYLSDAVEKAYSAVGGLTDDTDDRRLDLSSVPVNEAVCSRTAGPGQWEEGSDDITLLLVDRTFGTEPLSCLSPVLTEENEGPEAKMHPTEIRRLGLAENQKVAIATERGCLEVSLAADDRMAPGVVVIPRHHLLQWQMFEDTVVRLDKSRINPA
jgi:NADH-quinone oxidoreductase subunit G